MSLGHDGQATELGPGRPLRQGEDGSLRSVAALAISLLVGTVFVAVWPLIKLPFSNPEGLVGPLTEISYSPANNILRFLLVVLSPAACLAFLHYSKLFPLKKIEELEAVLSAPHPKARFVIIIGCALILYWGLVPAAAFFTASFQTGALDNFHEGESLTPAFNYLATKGLWTKSFFVHGLFWDPLGTFSTWKAMGTVSIGAERLLGLIIEAGLPFFIGLMIVSLSLAIRKELGDWGAALGGFFVLYGYLASRYVQYLNPRDIPVLLALSVFLLFLRSGRRALLVPVGVISALQWFVTIERAAYLFVGLMCVLIWRGWKKDAAGDAAENLLEKMWSRVPSLDWRGLLLFLGGYFAAAAAVFAVLGFQEFKAFLDNFLYFSRYKDYFDSYVFPNPIQGPNPIHSLVLFFICLQWLLLVRTAVSTPAVRQKVSFHVALLFAILSVVYFRSGLGRSDDYHLRYASSFAVLGLSFQLSIIHYLYLQRIVKPLVIVFIAFTILIVQQRADSSVFSRLWKVPFARERIAMLLLLPDEVYLTRDETEVRDFLKEITAEQSCFFTLTSEAAWPYLLRKPSCTKYYIVWFASAHSRQREIVADLEAARPEFILFDSPAWPTRIDNISQESRFLILRPYLLKTYRPFVELHGYRVFRRIDALTPAVEGGAQGWQRDDTGLAYRVKDLHLLRKRHDVFLDPHAAGARLRIAGHDPYILLPDMPRTPAGLKVLRIKLAATDAGPLQVDYSVKGENVFPLGNSIGKKLRVGENDVLIVLPSRAVGALRLHFPPGPGEYILSEVQLAY